MREIPEKHRHLDEAKRLELAQKEFDAAAKALVGANRSARAGGKLVTDEMQECARVLDVAQNRMREAEEEFDRATGGPKPVPLTRTTREKVRKTFAPELQDEATSLLETGLTMRLPFIETIEGLERVRLAVLKLANGDLAKLKTQIKVAKVDWRDVINPAEYPEQSDMSLLEYRDLDDKTKSKLQSRDREQYLNWLGKAPKQSLKDRIIGLFSRKN